MRLFSVQVTRLNTYTTVSAVPSWTPEQLTLAKSMDIVTFASPSAIKNWVSAIGVGAKAVGRYTSNASGYW
jgi:uroporphyrinogen-III synthase